MSRPPSELLPGAKGPQETVPPSGYRPHDDVRRARRAAALRDTFDTLLLVIVDLIFLYWPGTHVPFLSRRVSLLVLAAANFLLVTFWIVTRAIPRWRARRIAATWTAEERSRHTPRG